MIRNRWIAAPAPFTCPSCGKVWDDPTSEWFGFYQLIEAPEPVTHGAVTRQHPDRVVAYDLGCCRLDGKAWNLALWVKDWGEPPKWPWYHRIPLLRRRAPVGLPAKATWGCRFVATEDFDAFVAAIERGEQPA